MSTCAHSGWTTRAQARVREVTTVQLQRRHLRAGRLPVVAGHVADLLGAVRAQP